MRGSPPLGRVRRIVRLGGTTRIDVAAGDVLLACPGADEVVTAGAEVHVVVPRSRSGWCPSARLPDLGPTSVIAVGSADCVVRLRTRYGWVNAVDTTPGPPETCPGRVGARHDRGGLGDVEYTNF